MVDNLIIPCLGREIILRAINILECSAENWKVKFPKTVLTKTPMAGDKYSKQPGTCC